MADAADHELLRLADLETYRILDTPPEDVFDRLTRLAAAICETPMATLTLIDDRRQWFKSRVGIAAESTDRTHAFCAVCIAQRRTLVVPDTARDSLFAGNPFVTGEPHIRFYAGVPLISAAGFALGTLAVQDHQPRELTPVQRETLEVLARQAMLELELRRERLDTRAAATGGVADAVRGLLRGISDRGSDAVGKGVAPTQRSRDLVTQIGIVRLQQELASSSLDLQSMLDLMAERACAFVGGSGAQLMLIDGDVLVCRAAAGTLRGALGRRFTVENSLSGHSLRSGEALVCGDALVDPRVDGDACRLTGTRSLAVAPLREDGRLIGSLVVGAGTPDVFSDHDLVNLQVLAEALGATLQRHRIAAQLHSSETQYRLLFARNPHPMWVYETAGLRVVAVNQAAVVHYGYSEAEFLSLRAHALWAEPSAEVVQSVQQSPGREAMFVGRRNHRRKDGSIIVMDISAGAIDFNGQSARLVIATDVTQREAADREIARISRAQRMLRACNEILVRGGDEQTLLQTICRICVDIGGYRMAWVGFAQDDAEQSVKPMAWSGTGTDYLLDVRPSWSDRTPHGRGAIGRSIRDARTVVVADLAQNKQDRPWAERTLRYGFRGALCLPLRRKGRCFGVLCLYAGEVVLAGPDEIRLLEDLADDLAFGIGLLQAQQEQQRVQQAVLKVAAAVSTHTGKEFFQHLARQAADALGASGGFVSQLLPGEPARARTIAAVLQGRSIDNFDYAIAGSPCELLRDADQLVVAQDLGARFPEDHSLAAFDAQAYVGLRLDNAAGAHVGQLFLLFRDPLQDAGFVVPTLRIFAARIAGEMERQQSDAQIRHQASLLDQAQDAIIVRSIDHHVLYWNRSAERLYGWSAEEAVGSSIAELLYEEPSAFAEATHAVLTHDEWRGEILQRRKDGSHLQVEGHWTLVRDDDGAPQSILAINTDISQRKSAERRIHTLAFYDLLTGLPNRLMLADQLEQALATSAHSGMGGALLFIDLDNFKTLNDTVGHERGDRMLEQVGARLTANVRGVDTVARLGGDEFVVMLEALSEEPHEVVAQARAVGDKLLTALSAPYQIGEQVHQSTASIGIAVFTGQKDSVGELLKQADIAMYQAKGAGRNTLRFFDPGLQAALTARAAFEADLRLALLEQQLLLHYQPQSDADGRVTGVEALVRWRHPQRGLVSPAEFIPLAEETGLIVQLGRMVLREACGLLASWAHRPETVRLSMSVNVSAGQFRHPDFVAHVVSELDRSGADPTRLKIELTESLMVDDMDVTIAKMDALKARGVCFSLDDFGTGYSSLSYLKRLPLDQLKIDQSFVRDIMADANDTAIVQTIIALGRSLGLGVIAEGVETEGQRVFLAHHGCTAYQGYLFSRPLPLDQLEAFIAAQQTAG